MNLSELIVEGKNSNHYWVNLPVFRYSSGCLFSSNGKEGEDFMIDDLHADQSYYVYDAEKGYFLEEDLDVIYSDYVKKVKKDIAEYENEYIVVKEFWALGEEGFSYGPMFYIDEGSSYGYMDSFSHNLSLFGFRNAVLENNAINYLEDCKKIINKKNIPKDCNLIKLSIASLWYIEGHESHSYYHPPEYEEWIVYDKLLSENENA